MQRPQSLLWLTENSPSPFLQTDQGYIQEHSCKDVFFVCSFLVFYSKTAVMQLFIQKTLAYPALLTVQSRPPMNDFWMKLKKKNPYNSHTAGPFVESYSSIIIGLLLTLLHQEELWTRKVQPPLKKKKITFNPQKHGAGKNRHCELQVLRSVRGHEQFPKQKEF